MKYWDQQWKIVTEDPRQEEHSQSIPNDFLRFITTPRVVLSIIKGAKTVLDFGFGTGHLCHVISLLTRGSVQGCEISGVAVDYANKKYGNGQVSFVLSNILEEGLGDYDLIISSNTLEHFRNPFTVIDLLLERCKHLILLVPNKGTDNGGYDGDGGAGHVYSFNVGSFSDYDVLEAFTFFSFGWTELPEPLQLCVLLKGKL
jgi:2-polyprenyl-3-methyl-5-hydroxy-6-metoxy-1,4-benzoquinol methylase